MIEFKSKAERDLSSLKTTVETVLSLISRLLSAIQGDPSYQDSRSDQDGVNPFNLAHDAATLIKAHTTKLSLLIVNAPFTPTAILTVLRELSSGPLPALVTSLEFCQPDLYTHLLRKELQYRAQRVLSEFQTLVKEIPLDGKVLSNGRKNGTEAGVGKGSLASTGVVWAACDAVVELKISGIGGIMVKRSEQYRDTLKDAIEELREWGDEISEDGDTDAEGRGDDTTHEDGGLHEDGHTGNGRAVNSAQDALDELFRSERHIPASDPHKIRERLDRTFPKLKLMTLLYTASIKRRFKALPQISRLQSLPLSSVVVSRIPAPSSTNQAQNQAQAINAVERLDLVFTMLKRIPDMVDELASSFYELDVAEIDKNADGCFILGCEAAELLLTNWEGKEDEFTAWAEKFLAAMRKESNFMGQAR